MLTVVVGRAAAADRFRNCLEFLEVLAQSAERPPQVIVVAVALLASWHAFTDAKLNVMRLEILAWKDDLPGAEFIGPPPNSSPAASASAATEAGFSIISESTNSRDRSMTARACLGLSVLLLITATAAGDDRPRYTIYHTPTPIVIDGRLDEPAWFAAPSVGPFRFAWWKSGKKEQTVAKILWDDNYLYVAYLCQDQHISAKHKGHDTPVWHDDCVEVFAAPDASRPEAYFNIEMNANGAVFDAFHPHGPDSNWHTNWNADGLRIATRIKGTLNNDSDRDDSWTLEVAIPFKAYAPAAHNIPPKSGDVWRLNLNRCGGQTNEQFSQWAAGTEREPQFHTPRDFGFVTFSDKAVPF